MQNQARRACWYPRFVPDLVALDLPGGPAYVRAIEQTWARGDAIFPVDRRLPKPELVRVMEVVAPTAVIEHDGERRSLAGGRPTQPGDAAVVATSGTTGHPKGVVHTHASVAASAWATSKALSVDASSDRWLACLPLAHIGGLAVVMRSLVTGTPVEVHDGFSATAVIGALDRGATLVSLVTKALQQVPAERFRMILVGGAAPPLDRPANVWATYGLTETGSGVIYEKQWLDGLEVRIDDDQEVWLRGPMLLRCYRNAAAESGPTEFDPKDAAGWFPTGDLGRWADDGSLTVDGRKGDVIATGGEKVWPERAERVIAAQPGVADVAVVGRPHPEWGHEVVAVIVPSGSGPQLEQLRDAVRAELPVWYAPRRIELVESLPRTALGKLQRTRLTPR